MEVGFPEVLKVALRSVEECEVDPDESVVIYADSETDGAISEAWYAACVARGCDVSLVRAMARAVETDPPAAAVGAMRAADVVFDISSNDWGYAPTLPGILETGTRILQILLPRRSVIERATDPQLSWRADVSERLLGGAKEMRVTTTAGTDLRASLAEDRPLDVARGFVNKPGEWDSYGTNLIAVSPLEESVSGTIVFDGPLILLPQFTFIPREPIRVRVEEGSIVQVDGDHEDGRRFEWWFAQWGDPNAYLFSHIGWGWDPRADLATYDLAAWESYFGGVMVAFGSNVGGRLRGRVKSQAHMDGILLSASLWLDGLAILRDGGFTEESGLASDPRVP